VFCLRDRWIIFIGLILLLISGAYAITATDLIAYYDFNSGTTTLTDLVSGDNNGTNTATTISPIGRIGNSYYFNGSTAKTVLTNTGFPTTNFTLAMWIKTSANDNDPLYFQGIYATDGVQINLESLDPAHEINTFVRDQRKYTAIPADTNNWRFIVVDYNGSGASMLIDNTNYFSWTVSGTVSINNPILANDGGSAYYTGLIDEASIWGRTLTSAEKTELYNAGNGLSYCPTRTGYITNYDFNSNCTYTASTNLGRFNFYDESTGGILTDVSIDYNGTPQTISGSTYDLNLLNLSSTTTNYVFTISKTGYGTRYYQTDLNQTTTFNKNFDLLPDLNGSIIAFRFFEPDQTTKISNQYIEVLDYITGHTLGKLKTTTDGDINFFLNLNDANIHFLINEGQYDYNAVILTVKRPKDEDTGIDINATWNVIVSGLSSQSVLSTNDASKVFALYSNTIETYRIQIDSNGTTPITPFTYTSRSYLLNFYGNPLTATLQPYLLPTNEVVLTKLNTLQQTSLGITSLPGIVIKIYKSIPGQGVQLIQQVQTDGKGQAAVTLKTGDAYTFNLYQNGALLAFNQQTTIPINVITTTISFTISVGGDAPINPTSKGVFINWEPMDNSTPYLPTGTTWDINQILINKTNASYTAVLHAYIDGNELLIGGTLPKTTTSAVNTVVYNNIPWAQLKKGDIVFVMNITQADGNAYAYTMTYTLFANDSNISGTTYTFDILQGLRTGIRTDLGYNATELCPPLLGLALLIIFGSLGILTIKIGSFGGQGTVGMALAGMAFFTFINWIPLELTAIAFILGGAFIINDANLR